MQEHHVVAFVMVGFKLAAKLRDPLQTQVCVSRPAYET